MDNRIERFRNLHQNIWFHVMNDVLYELIVPKNLVSIYTKKYNPHTYNVRFNAWSPINSNNLITEIFVENIYKK
jgi:hypothetical protein